MRQRNVLLLLCLALLSTLKLHAQSRATARVHEDIIHTYAGGGPDGIPALSANLPVPTAVATDSAGNIYIAAPGGIEYLRWTGPARYAWWPAAE